MIKNIPAVILVLCCVAAASAQSERFRWTVHLCDYEGTYDAAKYTEAQLRNTSRMAFGTDFDIDTYDATVWKYEEIKNLPAVDKLDRDYLAKSAALRQLDIVKSPYWENFRQRKLKELEQVYQLARVTITGYTRPAALKDLSFADACVKRYAGPLISGGDELLGVWREVNEESRRSNADPERLRRTFEEQMKSPDRQKFALVEVMAFGWWNCANARIARVTDVGEVDRNFRKLFRRTKATCEEP